MQERARRLRHDLTETEAVLWRALRGDQLLGHKFRRQQTIGPYIVDFVDLGTKLIVELDGGQHADAVDYDERRDAWLMSEGYRVLRLWNNDVTENLEGVLTRIVEALSPPPQPSPLEGEGV
jgi:very-short-patch-repair endonuclease